MILLSIAAAFVVLFGYVVFFGAPYVPSLKKEVRAAFSELYPLSAKDCVVDLGSGDGTVLRIAKQFGVRRLVGYELNPVLALISRLIVGREASIRVRDMYKVKLPDEVTLVYVFSVSRDRKKLDRYFVREADRLGRPITVMTFGSKLPDERQPDAERNGHTLYTVTPSRRTMLTL